jgi:hypothetical protein
MARRFLGRRRFVLAALGLGAIVAGAAGAANGGRWIAPPRARRIGWFSPSPDGPLSVTIRGAFLDQMGEYGWIEGRNLTMDIWRADCHHGHQ